MQQFANPWRRRLDKEGAAMVTPEDLVQIRAVMREGIAAASWTTCSRLSAARDASFSIQTRHGVP
jgi:hypothetical protein